MESHWSKGALYLRLRNARVSGLQDLRSVLCCIAGKSCERRKVSSLICSSLKTVAGRPEKFRGTVVRVNVRRFVRYRKNLVRDSRRTSNNFFVFFFSPRKMKRSSSHVKLLFDWTRRTGQSSCSLSSCLIACKRIGS